MRSTHAAPNTGRPYPRLPRSVRRIVAASLMVSLAVAIAPAVAAAGVGMNVIPSFPFDVTVGQTAVAGSVSISNTSTNGFGEAGFDTDSLSVSAITLVPSCGSASFGSTCTVGFEDPGVIVPSPAMGTGQAGTACAGVSFTFSVIDMPQGRYQLTPDSTVILGPSSGPLYLRLMT